MWSTTCQHAIRALAELARRCPGTALTSEELAETAAMPAGYLSKILGTLRKAGILAAARGRGGGYRLARRPDEVYLLEIVRLIDGQERPQPCLLDPGKTCREEEPCPLHASLARLRDEYHAVLGATTLATLAERPAALDADGSDDVVSMLA